MKKSITTSRFYVYTLNLPDRTVIYIGKGSGARWYAHFREARGGLCDCDKCRVIRACWNAGETVTATIIFQTDDQQEAYAQEASIIAQHGLSRLINKRSGRGHVRDGDRSVPKSGA